MIEFDTAVKRRAVLLIAELLVVFIGVYAAFLLNARRDRLATEARSQQIYHALHEHFRNLSASFSTNMPRLAAGLDRFLLAHDNGEMPRCRSLIS